MLLCVVIISCNSSFSDLTYRNVSDIYNPASSNIFPEYQIYHENDSITKLLVRFRPTNLYFTRSDDKNVYLAKVKVKYKLYESLENGKLIDSSSIDLDVYRTQVQKHKVASFNMKTPAKRKYILEVLTTDMIKQRPRRALLEVDKRRNNTPQNFLLLESDGGALNFNRHFGQNKEFETMSAFPRDKFIACYYNKEFPLPRPPYDEVKTSRFEIKPDTIITVIDATSLTFRQDARTISFHADSIENDGFCTHYFHEYFPFIRTTTQMYRSLRYIAKASEYNKIAKSSNKKEAIDEFWLSITDDTNRAKELIKVYYRRVLFSNIYFTSFTEGWRTDRGMIYIIFGEPNSIYKTSEGERWQYGDNRGLKPLVFNFEKTQNKLSDNNFVLKRLRSYNYVWNEAISSWRQGRVYYIER